MATADIERMTQAKEKGDPARDAVMIELTAVVVAVTAEEPRVLAIEDGRNP
jgi:hypothetical protein